MSKARRGKGLRAEGGANRGTCPLCKRSGIKVIYEKDFDGKKTTVCKQCSKATGRGKMQEAIAAL